MAVYYSCVFAKRDHRESESVYVFPCFCVSVFLHGNSKNNQSINMKFEYVVVVYENISDKFDIGHCRTKVKVMARL